MSKGRRRASKSFRRYEILLPLRFNDGTDVPRDLIGQTLLELREHLGAVSCETQPIQGQWTHAGQVYHDDLIRAYVDVPDKPEHRTFFQQLKRRLKVRFQQLDIWVTSHPIDLI